MVMEDRSAFADKRCFTHRPSSIFNLWVWRGEGMYRSPFVSTLRRPTRISPSKQIFQWASGSPDEAYLNLHCMYAECRPVFGPSAFDFPIPIWWEIGEAPADEPQAEEVQTIGKWSRRRCTWRTPPPSYLGLYFRSISLQLEVGLEPYPEDADGSVAPAKEPRQGNCYPFRYRAANLRFCLNWPCHLLFVRTR